MGEKPRLSCVLLLLLLSAVQFISGQNRQILDNFQFYMDSNADCNGPERDIGDKRAYVFGKGANQLERGPTKCILRLRSVTAFENNRLRLEIAAMTIRDDFVTFSIFDGKENQILLRSFDKNNLPDITNTQAIITTGSSVTFVLERRDNEHTRYNIQMIVSPLILGEPGYENNQGNDFGYYYKRISNIGLVGIVVGVFGLVIIVVLAVSVYCYRNQKGMTAKWEQHKLSYVNTGVSLKPAPSSKGAMSDTASTVWASEVSRSYNQRPPPRAMGPRSRMMSASEDEDSVFDDSMDRRRPHDVPAKYSRYGRPPRNAPPRRSYKDESIDDSFVQADDDHPQNTYIERVIEPRVKSSRRPPRSTATTGVGPDGDDEPPPDQSEEEEEEDTEEEEEEEEEEEDDEEPPKRSQDRPKAPPRKSLANSKTSSHDHVDDPVPQAQAAPLPATVALPPGAAPYPMMAQPGMAPPYMPMGYAAMPPPYQPMAMAPPQPSAPEVQPTQPPIYSYLVQRGYVPIDGRTSPDSVSTAASASSNSRLLRDQGVERVGGLDSGVELMRR